MKYWAIASLALALSACGGGSSSNSNGGGNAGGGNAGGGIPPISSFAVSSNAGAGGSITPTSQDVNENSTVALTVTPDSGFVIDSVSGCNGTLSGDIYTTAEITADCEVTASFSTVSSTNNRVAYISHDQLTIDTDGLYIVDVGGANPSRLNPDLVSGGNVTDFFWSGDGTRVIYLADQEVDGLVELYSVLEDGSGLIKLNETLLDGTGITDFALSPAGDTIAYLARQNDSAAVELYTVGIDGLNNTKVNTDLVAGGNVINFVWSPDGSRLLYFSDLEINERFELYIVNFNGSNNQKVNNDLGAEQLIVDYQWSPLSGYISFMVTTEDVNITLPFEMKSVFAFNVSSGNLANILDSRIVQNVTWNGNDTKIAISDKDPIVGVFPLATGAYTTIWVNSPDGSELVDMTQSLPKDTLLQLGRARLREQPRQFSFVPNTGDFIILSADIGVATGEMGSTKFYVLSTVDGSINDSEPAIGEGGGFLNYKLGLFTSNISLLSLEQRKRFYEQEKYTPFTFSPDGRYIIINDHAVSVYDTQNSDLLTVSSFNFLTSYISSWIEKDGTFLVTRNDNSFDPDTYKRYFISPVVFNPIGSVIADIDELLGGDVNVARAVNPVLLGDDTIAFERFPTTQRPLMKVGVDGQSLEVLSNDDEGLQITDYQLSSDGNSLIYSQGCIVEVFACPFSALYSVGLDGTNRTKINTNIIPLAGIKDFAVQP